MATVTMLIKDDSGTTVYDGDVVLHNGMLARLVACLKETLPQAQYAVNPNFDPEQPVSESNQPTVLLAEIALLPGATLIMLNDKLTGWESLKDQQEAADARIVQNNTEFATLQTTVRVI